MTHFSLLLTLFACGDKSNDTASSDDTNDTSVQADAYSFQGMDFVLQSSEGFRLIGDALHLDFNADLLEMNFGAGCNSHSGEYEVVDGVFEMSGMGGTYLACEMELMDQDAWLVEFFTSSPSIEHDGDILTFTGSEATLIFADEEIAVPDQGLQDITWEIDTYLDGDTASAYNLNVLPNLYFANDGTFTANMGCNGASGVYEDNAGTLSMTIEVMTEAMCEGDVNTVEGHIFNVINNGPTYEIDGDSITLMAGDLGIGATASAE